MKSNKNAVSIILGTIFFAATVGGCVSNTEEEVERDDASEGGALGDDLPPTLPGVEHVLATNERLPMPVYYDAIAETNTPPESDVGTSSAPLVVFWGTPCTKGYYGWGQVAGNDIDFYVEYDCPKNAAETRAYTSAAYAMALAFFNKTLLVQNLGVYGANRRYRIVMGDVSLVTWAFGAATNWFVSTQAEMRYTY